MNRKIFRWFHDEYCVDYILAENKEQARECVSKMCEERSKGRLKFLIDVSTPDEVMKFIYEYNIYNDTLFDGKCKFGWPIRTMVFYNLHDVVKRINNMETVNFGGYDFD